jgi:hypothetical protein
MPKHRQQSPATGSGFAAPKKSMLDESNPYSYLPDNRSAQADYYKLENREKQLDMVESLSSEELKYVLGGTSTATGAQARTELKGKIQKIHEKDLIELRALVYLQSLPDTSPELIQLKTWCGCETREQIARFISDKQIKKLMMTQIEAITGGSELTDVYKTVIKRGPDAFSGLFK